MDPLSNSTLGLPAPSPVPLTEPDADLSAGSTQEIVDCIEQENNDEGEVSDNEESMGSDANENEDIKENEHGPTPENTITDALQYCQTLLNQHAEQSGKFAHLFSETILVLDTNDVKAVKAVLKEKNIPWKYVVHSWKDWDGIEMASHYIRPYMGPIPLKVEYIWLFVEFSDLFEPLLSSLYHCLVGHFNHTGQKWLSHFDIWLTDEIVELAISLNTLPSFCIPPMLATRIATSELFGIIPIPPLLAKEYNISTIPHGFPQMLPARHQHNVGGLEPLSGTIQPIPALDSAGNCVNGPSTPLFWSILKPNIPASQAWKGIDFIKFAQMWNLKV
ncbi:hypothetical protein BDP27DRAFT_1367678 [Rhodocollybia butyracea]|uniref:Uncharacterized protein n=1 Tax=Rhodocollybia butyracea TaxID=206335 RepID=A0A9P5PI44_9AGAR|nr:hypothetical protein BDP27DRAFT_1367678 [Rhodocollybia butyracea]